MYEMEFEEVGDSEDEEYVKDAIDEATEEEEKELPK